MFRNLPDKIEKKEEKLSLIGLGYVGLPIAIAFANKGISVIGYDYNQEKIELYKSGIDPTKEVGDEELRKTNVFFTSCPEDLRKAKFHIVAVPTPITEDKVPDLTALESASKTLGKNLTKGSIVVYESTVYPGVTEEICIPILEKESGLVVGVDFKVGYSPERINPGDKVNRLETIVKVVSGMDEESLDAIAKVYEIVVDAGVYKAESIKVAEAAKVIENIQRDLNIALVNELAMIFSKMGIDSGQVFNAAKTKWNFLDFKPGLVGGHCIGVDPFYLTYKAMEMGYHPEIILAGRRINDNMSYFIGNEILKNLLANSEVNGKLKIALFGITFKENIKDIRNSKVVDLYKYLRQYGASVQVHDPVASKEQVYKEYGIEMVEYRDINNMDAAVFCVAHDNFRQIELPSLKSKFRNKYPYIFDVKGIFDREALESAGFKYWRL